MLERSCPGCPGLLDQVQFVSGRTWVIKKLTWMLVNVVVSPLPDIMKNQETPENFLDPLCLV